jgi:hypothetical protein
MSVYIAYYLNFNIDRQYVQDKTWLNSADNYHFDQTV